MDVVKKGSCHCGSIEFEIKLKDGILKNLRHCDCSLCRRKGAVMAAVPIEDLCVTKGASDIGLYQWGTKVAEHYFCKTCGIYTHHKRRSNPKQFGVNIACLEGVNPFEFEDIRVGNGDYNIKL